MITRLAFFEGSIKPGQEAAFDAYVVEKLVPLWTRFPTVIDVKVMREISRDEGAPAFPLMLAITYPSQEGMEEALVSPVRMESREVTKGLFEYFEGRIFHVNGAALWAGPPG